MNRVAIICASSPRACRSQRLRWAALNPALVSNELSLTIVSATPEWQNDLLVRARDVLDSEPHADANSRPESVAGQALAALRYLGTPAAAVEMAGRLNDPVLSPQFQLGLAATPARDAAIAALQKLLDDPTFPVDPSFLNTMSLVALPSEEIADRPARRVELESKFREELWTALRRKQGEALAMSAFSLVEDTAQRSDVFPPDRRSAITTALKSGFRSLPASSQLELLESRWSVLDTQTMLDLLPQLVSVNRGANPPRSDDQANRIAAAALGRSWELDPQSARTAILAEIVRPNPRFGGRVLGVLPDSELPEVDSALAGHLSLENGSLDETTSLIARYATRAIETQVERFLDPEIGKIACSIQSDLLAYLLRVDREAALPRLRAAIEARGAGFTGCSTTVLANVAALHNDPALENIAVESLRDANPEIVGHAANYLAEFGSSAMEEPLWDALLAWNSRWKGREVELTPTGKQSPQGMLGLQAGYKLLASLATGRGWLTDAAKTEPPSPLERRTKSTPTS